MRRTLQTDSDSVVLDKKTLPDIKSQRSAQETKTMTFLLAAFYEEEIQFARLALNYFITKKPFDNIKKQNLPQSNEVK